MSLDTLPASASSSGLTSAFLTLPKAPARWPPPSSLLPSHRPDTRPARALGQWRLSSAGAGRGPGGGKLSRPEPKNLGQASQGAGHLSAVLGGKGVRELEGNSPRWQWVPQVTATQRPRQGRRQRKRGRGRRDRDSPCSEKPSPSAAQTCDL